MPTDSTVLATTIVASIWTLFTLTIRAFTRTRVNGPWAADDWAIAIATALGIPQSALVVLYLHLGETTGQPGSHHGNVRIVTAVANLLYVLAMGASKMSTCLLIQRIERNPINLFLIKTIIGITVTWAVVGAIVIALLGGRDGHCSYFTSWNGLELSGIVIEWLIFALAIRLVWPLAMSLRNKTTVALAFGVRLCILIPVAFRLRFLKLQLCESQTGQTETVGILTIITLHLAIMAATFVCMKQFLSALDSGLIGDHESPGVTLDTFRSPRSAGASKMMKSVDTNESNIVMRPDRARNVTRVQARASVLGDDDGMESDGSDRAIITRTKEWEVSYQNASSAPLTPL